MNIKLLLATSLSLITSYLAYTFITENDQVISPSLATQLTAPKINGAQLQNILSAAVKNQKLPGAVMYVSTPNRKWIGASGVSNLETKTVMKTNDGFSIASLKQYICISSSPSRDTTVVVLFNSQSANIRTLAFKATDIALNKVAFNK